MFGACKTQLPLAQKQQTKLPLANKTFRFKQNKSVKTIPLANTNMPLATKTHAA